MAITFLISIKELLKKSWGKNVLKIYTNIVFLVKFAKAILESFIIIYFI